MGEIKIDRSFTKDVMEDDLKQAIVESILVFTGRIRMRSCIEGIETHDGNHVEHWKNGVLHYEDGPAVIDVRDGVEEWWLDGKQVAAVKS